MIDEPNPEADEAHDIVMKQRGYERLHKDLQADAAKLAMWDALVAALAGLVQAEEDYGDQDNVAVNQAFGPAWDILQRARAIE